MYALFIVLFDLLWLTIIYMAVFALCAISSSFMHGDCRLFVVSRDNLVMVIWQY